MGSLSTILTDNYVPKKRIKLVPPICEDIENKTNLLTRIRNMDFRQILNFLNNIPKGGQILEKMNEIKMRTKHRQGFLLETWCNLLEITLPLMENEGKLDFNEHDKELFILWISLYYLQNEKIEGYKQEAETQIYDFLKKSRFKADWEIAGLFMIREYFVVDFVSEDKKTSIFCNVDIGSRRFKEIFKNAKLNKKSDYYKIRDITDEEISTLVNRDKYLVPQDNDGMWGYYTKEKRGCPVSLKIRKRNEEMKKRFEKVLEQYKFSNISEKEKLEKLKNPEFIATLMREYIQMFMEVPSLEQLNVVIGLNTHIPDSVVRKYGGIVKFRELYGFPKEKNQI
ncbi:MAG: hypothetical protein WC501_02825 [Candidatus Micrarchaeia archaeon]